MPFARGRDLRLTRSARDRSLHRRAAGRSAPSSPRRSRRTAASSRTDRAELDLADRDAIVATMRA